jgi:dihydrolipoamide dehydrogenase
VTNGERYDLTVIGSGPGGYVAAIRAAQLGQKVAIVEADRLGGVCLNWGCIPTKALLRNAEVVSLFRRAGDFGIACDGFRADFGGAVKRSRQIAEKFNKGVEFLMKKNSVRVHMGRGRLASPGAVQVLGEGEAVRETLETRRILLATGSRPKGLPGLAVDGTRVLTSTEAMVLPQAPKSIVIVGAGAVGVEFADIFHAYGAQVTLVEMLPQIVPLEDAEVAQVLARSFTRRGIQVRTGTTVEQADVAADGVRLRLGGEGAGEVRADAVLVAVGRAPNVEGLGLEAAGVATGAGGFIAVNERFETSAPGILAIGDVIGAPLLAHAASAEGIAAVEFAAGMDRPRVDPLRVPGVTYCHPQVASLGLTASKAQGAGWQVKEGKFPFQASGMAQASGDAEGFVKVVADAEYGAVLGVHIVGHGAAELIAEVGVAMTLEASLEDLAHVIHAHPTLSESVHEALLAAMGRALHL